MFSYFSNVAKDIYYGYVNVKCANKNCSRIFKISRNRLETNMINNYCCNMGCGLEYFNQTKIIDKEN